MRIGLISDTHGYLDPRVAGHFSGVDHILHAGDIGAWHIVPELEQIAPVTAVLGNNDADLTGRELAWVELGGLRVLVHHIVTPAAPTAFLRERYAELRPDIVVFGHTHEAMTGQVGGRLFVNPGYAGRPRFQQRRSIACLELGGGAPQVRFVDLS